MLNYIVVAGVAYAAGAYTWPLLKARILQWASRRSGEVKK